MVKPCEVKLRVSSVNSIGVRYISRYVLWVFLTLFLPFSLSLRVFAQASGDAAQPRIEARGTWDNRFLYFAFVIDNTDIQGVNAKPMSNAALDDSIALYFDASKEKRGTPDAQTNAMIVSAAGGFTFLTGDAAKKAFVPRPLFSVKYGVTLQGSLNRADDRDRSYTVTLAIPIQALGIDPKTLKPGSELGFNIVARQKGGGLSSLSPDVKTDADTSNPSKWIRLVLLAPDKAGAEKYPGAMTLPREPEQSDAPRIDGIFRAPDWSDKGAFAIASPHLPRAQIAIAPVAVPGTETDTVVPALPLDTPLVGLGRRTLAHYRIDYQADLRKPTSPNRSVFGRDGSLLLVDQPVTGVGPWFSTDKVNWHRGQLTAMREAGIDVALTQVSGPGSEVAVLDEKAILTMAAALREMVADRVPSPEVAPLLDTRELAAPGTKADLATEVGRNAVYAVLKQWFTLIPPEFRFRTLVPTPDGRLVRVYPIFLSDASNITNAANGEWAETLRKRFAAEFGAVTSGTTLLFIGGDNFAAGNGLAAAVPLTRGGPGKGALASYVIQPGFESPDSPLIPRKNGETYAGAWQAADGANADWAIIDSWNDFSRATEIAPSRQHGSKYLDITRILSAARAAQNQRAVRWIDNDAPRRLRPGQAVTVAVGVQNVGSVPLRDEDGVTLTYRWKQGDKVIAEAPLRFPFAKPLLPTRSAKLPVGVVAAKAGENGRLEPLPAGEYTVEIDFTSTPRPQPPVFFSEAPDHPRDARLLRIPVTVSDTLPEIVEFAGTTTPTLVKAGGIYSVQVRLRWLGVEPLKPDAASLVYQILTEDGKTTLLSRSVPFSGALAPGQWQTETILLNVGNDTTFPIACPESRKAIGDALGGVKVRWLLSRTASTDAIPGEYLEQIAVYPPEEEVRLAPFKADPLTADANAAVEVPVNVTNRGITALEKGAYRVGYHFYDMDGMEFSYRPAVATALVESIKPGETVKTLVKVHMPEREGVYILAFDLLRMPDTYISTRPVTRGGELALLPVRVNGGRLRFIDLTKIFNVSGVSWESDNGSGSDLDGAGSALPAESFPPDGQGLSAVFSTGKSDFANAMPYPSGYFAEIGAVARRIAFRYGDKAPGKNNAILCAGQTIPVSSGRYVALHLVTTALGGENRKTEITFRYKNGTVQKIPVNIGDWNRVPGASDPIAVRTNRKRGKDGDKATPCYLRHLIISTDITRELTGIVLPNDKKIAVFAATLEK
jgi:hypothetical protein